MAVRPIPTALCPAFAFRIGTLRGNPDSAFVLRS